jgi:hypothetical protein
MQKNIDRMVFFENIRKAILPVLVGLAFAASWIAFDLNAPVAKEILQGKAVRTVLMGGNKAEPTTLTYVELDNGRTVGVELPLGIVAPHEGERVSLTRYIKRFFGDSFGLN